MIRWLLYSVFKEPIARKRLAVLPANSRLETG
jgi:hypothetical protein